ncbi:MAG: lamin tail domain-containing protein, partial [Tepidiformaceae bacterium]
MVAGTSLHATSDGSLAQMVAAAPGAAFFGSVYAASDGGAADVTLSVTFLDSNFLSISPGDHSTTVTVTSPSFRPVTVSGTAPPGTAWVTFKITMSGAGAPLSAYLDSASLDLGVPPPPTTTEVPTDTPTPVPTSADAPTSTEPSGASPTATHTPRPTATDHPDRTATATKTTKPTSTPKPAKTATPTKTPKATATKASTRTATPTATATPQPAADSGAGGMLADGDFEQDQGGAPAGWSKFGGTMGLTGEAYDGDHAATLTSTTTSTKWLYQAVPVDGGEWYVATAVARIEGDGEASLRLSWYASADGSGSQLDEVDGDATTSSEWTELSTGPVQAPSDANSVRVRLMLRPASSAEVTATFDNASLTGAAAPPPTAVPTTPPPADGSSEAPPGSTPPPTGAGVSDGPTARAISGARTAATARPTAVKASRTATPKSGAAAADAPTLRFSEVLTNSGGAEGAVQWVELVNAGDKAVSTEGWSIASNSAASELVGARVAGGGYAVVIADAGRLPAGVLT